MMTTFTPDAEDRRVLIHTPHGKDARLACNVLESAGLSCYVCASFSELLHELPRGAGAVLTTEEAVAPGASAPLTEYLSAQPTWSDIPMLVFTKPGGDSPWINGAYDRLGNLTLLERPLRPSTLISSIRSALRARQRQYEIRLADHRKDEFLAMLAHELRNPLAPISAAAQLLKLASLDSEKIRQTSEIITRQVDHMTTLIDDLLDVARVTRGMVSLDMETLDIRQILSEAVEQASPLIRARKHHIALHLPPDRAAVHGDRKRLVQVVVNMLNNASKYTPNGGNIVVRLQVLGKEVVLDITDDGIGIAPEVLPRIFELFEQAVRNSDRAQGGLGLGLALVKSLVASHDGSVRATSAGLGKGSTFTIRLPRLEKAAPASTRPGTQHASIECATESLRVMIVDDNVDAASTMKMFLDAMGHEVCIEHGASGALERAKKFLPQICLLDIGLPDIDGYDLARRLRSQPETAGTTLIAITGYGQEQDRLRAASAGFDHHFVKPIDGQMLATLLTQVSPHQAEPPGSRH